MVSTASSSSLTSYPVDVAPPGGGLPLHLGSSMRPGARLEVWLPWGWLGELECTQLTETRLEFRVRGRFMGRTFDTWGKVELGPEDRCTIEVGRLRDPEARYCLQPRRSILISEELGGYAPSLRFRADHAETRVELRCTVDRVRPCFDLVVSPPRSSAW